MTPLEMIVVADGTVPLVQVLDFLRVDYQNIPGAIRCPIHKGGGETKPSARIYEDNRIFCHTCNTQYGPVDVWSSRRGISKAESAKQLLERWVPSEEKKTEILSEFTAPEKTDNTFAFYREAERSLMDYRHRVPLEKWRVWTRKLDEFREGLDGDQDGKVRMLTSFNYLMRKDFSKGD